MIVAKMVKARKASATAAFQVQVATLVDQRGALRHNDTVALLSQGKPTPQAIPGPNID